MIKKNNGITLPSLIIYITIMFVVLAIVMRVAITFRKNMQETTDVTFESEIEKLNMYMLEETRVTSNEIWEYTPTSIKFTDGNEISFKDEDNDGIGQIYFNEVKICDDVSNFEISATVDYSLKIVTITVDVTINEIQKEIQYVIKDSTTIQTDTRIPVAYQEVEYIQSTGTQFINTEYYANKNTRIYADFQYTEVTPQGRVFGSRAYVNSAYSTSYLTYEAYINGNTTNKFAWACKDGEGNWAATNINASTNRMQIDLNSYQNSVKYTGSSTYSTTISTTRTTTTKFPIYIFSSIYNNGNDTAGNYGKLKLYSLFIEEEGIRVRDFVPCYRISDGEVGLYDMIGMKFYSNGGTGEFLKGNSVKFEDVYQEVEYIESTGTQYIDTGVTGKSGLKMDADISLTALPRAGAPLFGSYGNSQRCYLTTYSSATAAGMSYVATTTGTFNFATGTRYHIESDMTNGAQSLKINDTTVITGEDTTALNTGRSIFLFGYNNSGTFDTGYPVSMKLYSFKLYDGETLIRDYIPCYRKYDGLKGLYDKVTKTFYGNKGTQAFRTGGEVNSVTDTTQKESNYVTVSSRLPFEYQETEYIQSTGIQYIKTGIFTSTNKIEQYAKIQIAKLNKRQLMGQNYGWWYGITASNYYEGAGTTTIMPSDNDYDTLSYVTDYPNLIKTMTINGESVQQTATASNFSTGLNKEIYIFNINNYANASMSAKLKSFKISVNDELVRDFIPCYRKADGIAGLYDLVEGEFYNNSGAGYFIKGPDVFE